MILDELFEIVNGDVSQDEKKAGVPIDKQSVSSEMRVENKSHALPAANNKIAGGFDVTKLIPVRKEEGAVRSDDVPLDNAFLSKVVKVSAIQQDNPELVALGNKKSVRKLPFYFIKKIPKTVSVRNIRRVPRKVWAVLIIVILTGYFGYSTYQSFPRQFPLEIKAAKSIGKNNLATYVLSEKPKLLIKKPKINPIVASLVRVIAGSSQNGMRLTLTTPRKNDIGYDVKSSIIGSKKKFSLIPKASAQELEGKLAEKIVLTQEGDGIGMKLPSLDEVRGAPRGRYIASVNWVEDGISYNSSFAFSWGVLVLNADKDRYAPGEKVRVGAGMVDDRGYTICEGDVTATITDPSGKKVSIRTPHNFSSSDKQAVEQKSNAKKGIKGAANLTEEQMSTLSFVTGADSTYIATSPACGPHSITDDPDYSFQFSVPMTGRYTIDLSATTEHGTEHVSQAITVGDTPIEIARTAAMRIYPLADYEMKITVKAENGYSGKIVEKVPVEFGISCDNKCKVDAQGDIKLISWDAEVAPNEPETFSYIYDPPDVSPALYFAGPVAVGQRIEDRVWAIAFDAVVPQVTLTQRNYIFEDDDGTNVRNNSDVAAADTAITSVKKGERISVRFQVDNTSANTFFNPQFELFYDRSDNIWTRATASGSAAVVPNTGNCTDTNWDCAVVNNSVADVGAYSAVAVDQNGSPWVAYQRGTGNGLSSARYVGSGGNCGGSSGAWSCTVVDSSAVATDIDIAISASGSAWISYKSGNYLKVASFLGSGGNCTDTAWGCTSIEFNAGGTYGQGSSIAFDQSGVAWVSYRLASLPGYAKYVGSGGTLCSAGTTEWTCSTANGSATVPVKTSIAFDQSGNPWMSVYNSGAGGLRLHTYVGSGGNCTLRTAWNCTIIDATSANIGNYNSIKFDASGSAWISYQDTTNGTLKVAKYVGSGGNCTDTAWSCTVVDNTAANMGQYTSISFDPTGNAWISYEDATNGKLRVAQYVGSGGSGCKSGVTDWLCTNVDGASAAQYTSIEFDPTGNAWISYYDSANTRLKYARIKRGGEIISGYGLAGMNGDAFVSTAAGACGGGTSFVTGIWTAGVYLASGAAKLGNLPTNKCTEISFMIDTSYAVVGTTYRLKLHNFSPGYDIGLGTYSQNPTFTVVDSASDNFRASKDQEYSLSNCSDNTSWGCGTVNSNSAFASQWSSITMDASGSAQISNYDLWNGDLWVSRYVGANGGGCGVGVTAWKCTKLEHGVGSPIGEYSSIGVDPKGKTFISYYDRVNGDLKIAEFVGSGGSGCSATPVPNDWTCTTIDSANDTGGLTSIAFDAAGNPWISEYQGTNQYLRLARYVGSNGTGCAVTTWTCYDVDRGSSMGRYTTIKFDQNNTPWISYTDQTNNAIRIAHYVGTGGGTSRGCSAGSSTEWACETIDDQADTLGQAPTASVIDNNNVPWVAYYDLTVGDLWVAKYVVTGGSGCTSSTNPGTWSCTKIEATNDVGNFLSMALGPDNKPWISYYDTTNTALRVARYVGGAVGTGCLGGGTGSTDWSCTAVDNVGLNGGYSAIAFDKSGVPWIAGSEMDVGVADDLRISKLHLPYFDNQVRYSLDDLGYTAVGTNDQTFDSMAAITNSPVYRFSSKFSSADSMPTAIWIGKSSVAASTDNILLQVYRFGSTNAWETLTTNSTCGANLGCSMIGTPSGTLNDYFDPDGSSYWSHFRVYQVGGTSKTLQAGYSFASVVTKIGFTTPNNGVTSGVCSGASIPFTIATQGSSGVAASPQGDTVVRVTSDSSSYTIYSDSSCSTPVSNGDFTFTTSVSTQTFYIVDSVRGSHTFTATYQSGPSVLASGSQFYNTLGSAGAPSSNIKGGTIIKGGTTIR